MNASTFGQKQGEVLGDMRYLGWTVLWQKQNKTKHMRAWARAHTHTHSKKVGLSALSLAFFCLQVI